MTFTCSWDCKTKGTLQITADTFQDAAVSFAETWAGSGVVIVVGNAETAKYKVTSRVVTTARLIREA